MTKDTHAVESLTFISFPLGGDLKIKGNEIQAVKILVKQCLQQTMRINIYS